MRPDNPSGQAGAAIYPASIDEAVVKLAIEMANDLMNILMKDGSRRFGELPQTVLWEELSEHIVRLKGATVTQVITDHVTEGWIDFTFCGHRFSVNDQFGDYWFFVEDPRCPEAILQRVIDHCGSLLTKDA